MNISEKIKNIHQELQKARDYYPSQEEYCIKSIDSCIDLLKNYLVSGNLSVVYQNLQYPDCDILEANVHDVIKNDLTIDLFKSKANYELDKFMVNDINQLLTGLSKVLDIINIDFIKNIIKLEEKRLSIMLSSLLNFNQDILIEDEIRNAVYPINDIKGLVKETVDANMDYPDILSINLLNFYNQLKTLKYKFMDFEEYCKSTLPNLNSKYIETILIDKLKELKASILNKEVVNSKFIVICNLLCIYNDISSVLLKAQYYYKHYLEIYNYCYKYLERLLMLNKSYK